MALVYFLYFLAWFRKCVIDKRAGSVVKWKASWIMNQQAGVGTLRQVTLLLWTCTFFSNVTKVLCGIFNCLPCPKEHRVSGCSWKNFFCLTFMRHFDHLPFLRVSFSVICHLHEICETLQRTKHLSVTEILKINSFSFFSSIYFS